MKSVFEMPSQEELNKTARHQGPSEMDRTLGSCLPRFLQIAPVEGNTDVSSMLCITYQAMEKEKKNGGMNLTK